MHGWIWTRFYGRNPPESSLISRTDWRAQVLPRRRLRKGDKALVAVGWPDGGRASACKQIDLCDEQCSLSNYYDASREEDTDPA